MGLIIMGKKKVKSRKGSYNNAGLAKKAMLRQQKMASKSAMYATMPELRKVWDNKKSYTTARAKVDVKEIIENHSRPRLGETKSHVNDYNKVICENLFEK